MLWFHKRKCFAFRLGDMSQPTSPIFRFPLSTTGLHSVHSLVSFRPAPPGAYILSFPALMVMHLNHSFPPIYPVFKPNFSFLPIKRLWCLSVECVRLEKHLSSAASWLPKARLVLAEDNQQFSHKQDKKKKKGKEKWEDLLPSCLSGNPLETGELFWQQH